MLKRTIMEFLIKTSNQNIISIVSSFEKDFKKKIEKNYSVVAQKTIEIHDENTFQNTISIDMNSPMQCMAQCKCPILSNDCIIILSGNKSKYSERQQLALLAHEIGHLILTEKGEDCGGVKEEIAADSCAVKLNLGCEMVESLEIMKKNCGQNLDPALNFFSEYKSSIQKTNTEFEERIAAIQKRSLDKVICFSKRVFKAFYSLLKKQHP